MKRMIVTLIATLSCSGVLFADGNIAAGKEKAATCAACHSLNGISPAGEWPNLAGQGKRYLQEQITKIKSGERDVPTMMPFVTDLSEQDIQDLAAYYASLTPPLGATDSKYVSLGEAIYRSGDAKRNIPACTSCHTIQGKGMSLAAFPLVAGQKVDYTIKRLNDLRKVTGAHEGNALIMHTIAIKLTNEEIEAVANYINGLR